MSRVGRISYATNGDEKGRDPTRRHYIGATIFIFFSALVFFYWAGFPLNNTVFEHGHPNLASELPGLFKSSRYTYEWWLLWALSMNALPPLLLAIALTETRVEEYAVVHGMVSGLMLIVSGTVFVLLYIQSCINCNTAFSVASTWCNDYRYCCAYFSITQEAIERCPNSTPCIPDITSDMLGLNGEYVQHIIFALVFAAMALAHLGVKDRMSRFGVFTNQQQQQ